ncbi:hypothetical protein [Flavisphingomonas formosensis]|uniref:hypothetical protein n=1 Tax=Flavisphingomonas formosensis TaxID=861534 RepID=UPI0012F78B64|nr:hypothetical protein [Sphingomonas formosensis]
MDRAELAAGLMTTGGDRRIAVDPGTGLNPYLVAPQPSGVMAYSSSTANAISPAAFAEVQRRLERIAPDGVLDARGYRAALDGLRERIRRALRLPASTEIVFAASGTDLEYVGLAVGHRAGAAGIDNMLLGADEVGSGCIHSSRGHYFADRTPLGLVVAPGEAIDPANPDRVRLHALAARGMGGVPMPSEDLLLEIGALVDAAARAERHALVHVVHGSKTGLILPSFAHIDALRRRFGDALSFVVDACQCRLGGSTVASYLARGATVFLTGSKFMGGPPFSGVALVPRGAMQKSAGMLPGFERLFCRAEWPESWPGAERLPEGANLGLLLRLEASIYELELYQRLTPADVRRTLDLFDEAVDMLTARLGAVRAIPQMANDWQDSSVRPQEMRTLVTVDLGQTRRKIGFERSRKLYRMLLDDLGSNVLGPANRVVAARRIRLGQPVKCIPLPEGGYAGTLRIGLSMPQMVEFAAMDSASLQARLQDDMGAIAAKLDIVADL